MRVEQDPTLRAWAAVAAAAHGESAVVSMRHVVIACARELSAAGAGLSMIRSGGGLEPVFATGAEIEALEETQFTLGEGPGIDAAGQASPVLVPDLTCSGASTRWPMFAQAAIARGIRGVFAFPVHAGAALLGVLAVYRPRPGPLTVERELQDALVFADAVLALALDQRGGIAADLENLLDNAINGRRAQVHQAAGMVAAKQEVSVIDALAALRAYSYARARNITEVAADVVARRIHPDLDRSNSPYDSSEGGMDPPPQGLVTHDPGHEDGHRPSPADPPQGQEQEEEGQQ